MILGVPASELAWLAGLIVVGGAVTGILAGLFGIGGGALIVPVLYEVFDAMQVPPEVRMQLCIGTSLAIIVPTTFRSYRTHLARGVVMEDVVRAWWLPAVAGVGTGALIAAFAPGWVFQLTFAIIASIIAIRLLIGRDDWRVADDLPKGAELLAYGYGVGLSSALMGVSGGSVSNMILTLHGKPIHRAVATSAGLGVPITIAGTVGFILAGLPKQALHAAAVDRLCLADRVRADGADLELHRELWSAPRSRAAEAMVGDRIWNLPADSIGALCVRHHRQIARSHIRLLGSNTAHMPSNILTSVSAFLHFGSSAASSRRARASAAS